MTLNAKIGVCNRFFGDLGSETQFKSELRRNQLR